MTTPLVSIGFWRRPATQSILLCVLSLWLVWAFADRAAITVVAALIGVAAFRLRGLFPRTSRPAFYAYALLMGLALWALQHGLDGSRLSAAEEAMYGVSRPSEFEDGLSNWLSQTAWLWIAGLLVGAELLIHLRAWPEAFPTRLQGFQAHAASALLLFLLAPLLAFSIASMGDTREKSLLNVGHTLQPVIQLYQAPAQLLGVIKLMPQPDTHQGLRALPVSMESFLRASPPWLLLSLLFACWGVWRDKASRSSVRTLLCRETHSDARGLAAHWAALRWRGKVSAAYSLVVIAGVALAWGLSVVFYGVVMLLASGLWLILFPLLILAAVMQLRSAFQRKTRPSAKKK